MCSGCGRNAIISGGCGCSGSGNGTSVQNASGCGGNSGNQQKQCGGLLKTAACGLTSTIFRIVNGADNLLSGNCGCRG